MAVERLEEQIKAQPDDFALRLQLAEVHALYCRDLCRAEKVIQQLPSVSGVTPGQLAEARARLKAWRAAAER